MRPRASIASLVGVVGAVGIVGGALLVACVDPRTDYDDYVNRTNGVRGVTSNASDAAVQEAAAIDGGFANAPFFVACLPALVGGNLRKALRFAATMTYTPSSATTKAGTVALSITPLAVAATDMGGQVGGTLVASTATVHDDGTFDAAIGMSTVPGAANPISTNDIVFSNILLRAHLLRADFACAELDGTIVLPQMLDLNDPGDYCVFQRVSDLTATTATPTLTADQFQHCP